MFAIHDLLLIILPLNIGQQQYSPQAIHVYDILFDEITQTLPNLNQLMRSI
jgi:hypothetical protein